MMIPRKGGVGGCCCDSCEKDLEFTPVVGTIDQFVANLQAGDQFALTLTISRLTSAPIDLSVTIGSVAVGVSQVQVAYAYCPDYDYDYMSLSVDGVLYPLHVRSENPESVVLTLCNTAADGSASAVDGMKSATSELPLITGLHDIVLTYNATEVSVAGVISKDYDFVSDGYTSDPCVPACSEVVVPPSAGDTCRCVPRGQSGTYFCEISGVPNTWTNNHHFASGLIRLRYQYSGLAAINGTYSLPSTGFELSCCPTWPDVTSKPTTLNYTIDNGSSLYLVDGYWSTPLAEITITRDLYSSFSGGSWSYASTDTITWSLLGAVRYSPIINESGGTEYVATVAGVLVPLKDASDRELVVGPSDQSTLIPLASNNQRLWIFGGGVCDSGSGTYMHVWVE